MILKAESPDLDAIRQEREELFLQIRQSQEAIERSRELLRRLDELLAKAADDR
jgi:hypothetical protein